ncbi:hypothetical protein ACIBF6_02235 [Streptosporangium amethystogenes]|uniref:hypothetical protein n=1 Tax=Streptosporangium amethystogenes TaxID=2002 RepID=UPI00379B9870
MSDDSGPATGTVHRPEAPVRRPSVFSMVLATVAGLGLLALTLPSIGPTVRAAYADGVRGTFTAVHLSCVNHPGHEACSWYGRFRPEGGVESAQEVYLYGSDREMLRPGRRTAAVDVGRGSRVYGPGGSREWVFVGLLTLAGLGLLGLGGRTAVRLGRRRMEER